MPRTPAPTSGMQFDETFTEHFSKALEQNPSVHDGAIMIHRLTSTDTYWVAGWSYRLFPPPIASAAPPNRGSAFNSCLAMSEVGSVDALYLLAASGIWRFFHGRSEAVDPAR